MRASLMHGNTASWRFPESCVCIRENRIVESVIDPLARERELNSTSRLTAIVVLATVTMTFGAMITVFIGRSQAEKFWGHLQVPSVLWLTTAVLLASSATFEIARLHLKAGEQHVFFRYTAVTAALGFAFLVGQIAAWLQILHSGIVLARNPHSWFVFLFTGLHGAHIVVGLAGLLYLLQRTRRPVTGPKYNMMTRVVANGVAIFWHYLDFVWLVLFGLLIGWRR